ncbi:putative translation initiation factor IF-2, mitochondrial [Apostichopus japonicus]|uniref:Putative translation initiation factor IF-2, mitochondrial n=1 Tax=Stichopus japonicus TaxID=307972 RepID=A0A2G8KUL3_STIJA|nr:putative translation initiation factor IF-2, mitochondrial [Apostichopus japonicus]
MPAVVRNYAQDNSRSKSSKSWTKKKQKSVKVQIRGPMSVRELASAAGIPQDSIYELILERELNLKLEPDTVLKVPLVKSILDELLMDYIVRKEKLVIPKISKDVSRQAPTIAANLVPRPAVVTIMGHVDHGKTTLLDSLRKTSVAAQEAGGITQHIGAFQGLSNNSCSRKGGISIISRSVLFYLMPLSESAREANHIPGHTGTRRFKAMRERGANITDIVVLVVAADDGVMEQTKESIKYAQNANVPLIVAINKCDKPDADPDFTKRDLLSNDIILEEFGGNVQAVEISALKSLHLDDLTDAIITQAEIQELKADRSGPVEAVIVESRVDKGKGSIATAIIQRGTLEKGAVLVAGDVMCRVRTLHNERGQTVKSAGPSIPVEITGWKGNPSAGDVVLQVESEQRAREVLKWRQEVEKEQTLEEESTIISKKAEEHQLAYRTKKAMERAMNWREVRVRRAQERYSRVKESFRSGDPELNIVIKGDVDGSVEAILDVLSTYGAHHQCKLEILRFGVGVISDKDVELAHGFQGIVYGFNVDVSREGQQYADENQVPIKHHSIIYKFVEDLKDELSVRIPPKDVHEVVGEATVIQPFDISVGKKKVPVAGCRVNKGQLVLNGRFKLLRNNKSLHEGMLDSLKHHKDDVAMVTKEMECGVMFQEPLDYLPGDTILCYEVRQEQQTVDWDLDF